MASWKIATLQVDLQTKKANVGLLLDGTSVMVLANGVEYDQPGEQTESQLKELAVRAVQKVLRQAAEADLLDKRPPLPPHSA